MVKLSALTSIPAPYRLRVRYRLTVLAYATEHGPTAAARRYGVCPRTVRRWRVRWRAAGLAGLIPRYPRRRASRLRPEIIQYIHHARATLQYGAARTRVWLLRVHRVRLAMRTIQRVFGDLGLPYLRRVRKRAPRQLKLFEKAEPGESVQVDVKFVKIAGHWAFQYTALDDCTRFRVLRLYRQLYHGSSLAFLAELRRAFPFPIQQLQCDNGREFPLDFALAVGGGRDPASLHPPPAAPTEREGRAEPPDRSRGVLEPADLPRLRGRRRGASPLGGHLQLRAPVSGPEGAHPGREACGHPAASGGLTPRGRSYVPIVRVGGQS